MKLSLSQYKLFWKSFQIRLLAFNRVTFWITFLSFKDYNRVQIAQKRTRNNELANA